jgi:hypothetical protein
MRLVNINNFQASDIRYRASGTYYDQRPDAKCQMPKPIKKQSFSRRVQIITFAAKYIFDD